MKDPGADTTTDPNELQYIAATGRSLACNACDTKYRGLNHKYCKLLSCLCPQHTKILDLAELEESNNVPVNLSVFCAGMVHTQCEDNTCFCPCHDVSDRRSRWKCPSCKAFVYERMAKVCSVCHERAIASIQNSRSKYENDPETPCLMWPSGNCIYHGVARADACVNCQPAYEHLSMEDMDRIWEQCLLRGHDENRKKLKEQKAKGIEKAITID